MKDSQRKWGKPPEVAFAQGAMGTRPMEHPGKGLMGGLRSAHEEPGATIAYLPESGMVRKECTLTKLGLNNRDC